MSLDLNNRYYIAITGTIGSGKTAVSNILKSKGYTVFDVDLFSRSVIKNSKIVKDVLVDILGECVLSHNDINLKKVGAIFDSRRDLEVKFECWYQNFLGKKIKERVLSQYNKGILFFDIPMLEQKDIADLFYDVWFVKADEEICFKRVKNRNNYSSEKTKYLIECSSSEEQLHKRCTTVYNGGTIKQLEETVDSKVSMLKNTCIFKEIAQNVVDLYDASIKERVKINTEICPDVIAGTLTGSVRHYWFNREERKLHEHDLAISKNSEGHTILLVLESPHIDEFSNEIISPSPALGKTGENLQSKFDIILQECIDNGYIELNGSYRIILMNSVQYQCSLGFATKYFRNKIFSEMWKQNEIKQDFCNRIRKYQPDYIFNFCTGGNKRNSFRSVIQKEIMSSTQKPFESEREVIRFFIGNHPASWFFNKNNARFKELDGHWIYF